MFITLGLASSIYPFTYTVTDGCASDNESIDLEIFSPSQAGDDGVLSVCLNEPFNLLSGLSGNVDFGGTWFNPQNEQLASAVDTASSIGGQFNYLYTVSNGVCPNDSSTVTVNVNSGCDYNVGLNELEEFVNVFPNPTNDILNIQISKVVINGSIQVEDLNGKIVKRILSINEGNTSIDLSEAMNGIYIVRLRIDSGEYITKIVKN
jgi:hypothetical protein